MELGEECGEDGSGSEVIVTSLALTSMPIIRYKVGDFARIKDLQCHCGDKNPVLTLVKSRMSQFLVAGETKISGIIFRFIFEELKLKYHYDISSYQVSQTSKNNLNILLTLNNESNINKVLFEKDFRSIFTRILPNNMGLNFEIVEKINTDKNSRNYFIQKYFDPC